MAFGNGVNFADGLDGWPVARAVAFAAYAVLTLAAGQRGLGLFCALLVGALLAFLWHNAHPAICSWEMWLTGMGQAAVVAVLSGSGCGCR